MTDSSETKALTWHSPCAAPFRLTGLPWFEQEQVYRRLPRDPDGRYPEAVNGLANCTAGGQVHFRSDAANLAVRVALRGPHAMDHMPTTGQCGVDCYIGDPGQVKYCSTTRSSHDAIEYQAPLISDWDREWRTVTLNLPLYQGVETLEVGLDADARIEPPPPFAKPGKVIFYGTSITQGGCASRPGMAYTNLLSRWLNVETVNLGFSGNGRGEPELAEAISVIPSPVLFVLDYEANAGLDGLRATLVEFVRILRSAHPRVTILLVSRPLPAGVLFRHDAALMIRRSCDFQADTVANLQAAGDDNIHFFNGADLLGEDFEECTVDGVHPTDLGFYRMAKSLEPVLRALLFG